MLSFMIFCHVWFLHTGLSFCSENSTVIRFSVLEDQQVCLPCGGPDSSDVVWTHRDREVLVTRQGGHETNEDVRRYRLLPDGRLCLLKVDEADGGVFGCNQQLVAELQVLSGHDLSVSAGRTLLLPGGSTRHRLRWWFRRRTGGRREVVFTRFRNGTARAEREGGRLSYDNRALQIHDLQPEDAGEYQCNGERRITVTVLTVSPEPTNDVQQTIKTTATLAVMETDVVEKKKEQKKRPENALLILAVVGLGLMIVLLTAVCVLLTSMKCRRRKKYRAAAQRHEDTELQPWTPNTQTELYESPSVPEETIHYASLGRHNWRERPCRTPPDQNLHNVIYSSVITRPAAK